MPNKDGIFKNNSTGATYFVKGDKIIMRLNNQFYQTSKEFMMWPEFQKPLDQKMEKHFDEAYSQAKKFEKPQQLSW